MTAERALGWAGFSSVALSALYLSWSSMCLGPSGTEYLMTGSAANPLAATCSVYDYSDYFPGFEKKTDSLRTFRPIFDDSIGQP